MRVVDGIRKRGSSTVFSILLSVSRVTPSFRFSLDYQ